MPRITPIDPATATGDTALHLATTKKLLGSTPNVFTTAANSPSALKVLNEMVATLGKSSLGGRQGELVAVAVAQSNGCAYCLSAHTAIGGMYGLAPDALAAARSATSADPKTAALLRLAVAINTSRGHLSDAQLAEARMAGLSDREIVDTVAHVAMNVLTNYLNSVAETAIDFPIVALDRAA